MSQSTRSGPGAIGRYEVIELIGTGNFAAVYRAHDPALDNDVAIKVLADHHSAVPELRERFIAEARTLRRVGGGRIVTVFDIGEIEGQPYFVTELLDGTLAERRDRAPLNQAALASLVDELAECLRVAHERGVVHRDIKPSNLLIRSSSATAPRPDRAIDPTVEELVLGDLGLARSTEASRLTVARGTDGYAAPEQRSPSSTIDGRADLYAASSVVLEFATGDHVGGGPTGRETLPPRFEQAIRHGLENDPADRPPDADAWHHELTDALTPVETAPARRSSRWIAALGVGLALVAAVLAIATIALRDTTEPDGPAIVGPAELTVGDTARYRFVPRAGATYTWVDARGTTFDEPELEVTARSAGTIELTLVERLDGAEQRSVIRIEVDDP